MKTGFVRTLLLGALLTAGAAAPAFAQQGFALKGHYIYNQAAVEEAESARDIPAANGFGLGLELVLPGGFGVGVAGYTGGRISEFDRDASSVTALVEANYFLRLPLIPLAPYAGAHAGLGNYTREDLGDPATPRVRDSMRQLGYQVGLRFQATSLVGLDAQYRRVSTSLGGDQHGDFSRNQVLVGVTLF